MKPTPKADECIRMIKKVEKLNLVFSISARQEPITDKIISGWGSRKDEFLQLDKDMFNNLLYWGKYYSILVNYRLFPFAQIRFKGNSSFKNYKGETIIKEFSDFADKHLEQIDNNILWQVLTEYDEVTSEDLEKEFWDIIPDLSSVQEYYNVMKMKYKNVFSEIPDKDYWNYFKLIKDDNFMAYYNSLIRYEIATQNEVETLIMKICNVVERLDIVISSIIDVYKSFLPTPTATDSISEQSNDKTTTGNQPPRCNPSNSQQPPHFNGDYTDEELTVTFEKLKQGSYIHSESDLDSWIYLCTGRAGKTFTAPINWLKSGVLLGMFVQDLFNDTDNTNIWELTAKCFTIQGKKPNTNSIKVSLSKIKQNWKDRPKDYDKMQNEIIKDIT